MNAVGIDVSKGKSMVAIMRPFGESVVSPFEVNHTSSELSELTSRVKSLTGETKVVMECTGSYYLPIAIELRNSGLRVCAVNAQLIHGFGNNSIRKVKTDRADAVKIAKYALIHWGELSEYTQESDVRHMLKAFSRQYNKYGKIRTMLKNDLISLLDQTFPSVNELFKSPPRKSDGHEKWFDFVAYFWHCKCVCDLSKTAFSTAYRKWCKRSGYLFNQQKADTIYANAVSHISVMPKDDSTKLLITNAVAQICAISETIASIAREMKRLAASLPEYPIVIAFSGVGEILAPQLIAEIGDVFRYPKKSSLVRFAGLEPVENQSGKLRGNEKMSKQGSPHLRKTLFQVMDCLLKNAPPDDPVYQFLDRKRSEGKHYYCFMNARAAMFLRIYFARLRQFFDHSSLA